MRIAFVGKGGSGKTTLASLFGRFLASQGKRVLAIDADINQHLAVALGLGEEGIARMQTLSAGELELKEYFKGTNERIISAGVFMKTTPPGSGSNFMTCKKTDPLVSKFFFDTPDGVSVARTGSLGEKEIGMACFHSKVMVVEILLNHLLDRKDEYMIVDMTAGADSFASGIFTKFDVMYIAVEPTKKSLDIYHQFKQQGAPYGITIRVIGNKVENEDDLMYLRQHVGSDLLGYMTRSAYVKKTEQGEFLPIAGLERENSDLMARMQEDVSGRDPDWGKLYRQTVELHVKNAITWMNARMGVDLTAQVDPSFDLKSIAEQAHNN